MTATSRELPTRQCDIVMKGGVTSGVVYPGALCELGRSYRFRQLGGASAGAIGAAMAAAAEYGRSTRPATGDRGVLPTDSRSLIEPPPASSFDALASMPAELGGGRLRHLFQAEKGTKGWLRLMLAATGTTRPISVPAALWGSWPLPALIGALPGVLPAAYVLTRLPAAGPGAAVTGAIVMVVLVLVALAGSLAGAALGAYRSLCRDVVANQFGICSGLATGAGEGPGFTDWLSARVNTVAGLAADGPPLTFGQLWDCPGMPTAAGQRSIDLRVITTCLSEGRPYEMPWDQKRFFYSVEEWTRLFPAPVMQHLLSHEAVAVNDDDRAGRAAHQPVLHRLPEPADIPIIVATRMSLSFPLLISAVPMWAEDPRRSQPGRPVYVRVWFTDGGFCSNFPVHLFDAALPTRPTFAISLDQFDDDGDEDPDNERRNIRYSRGNRPVQPRVVELPDAGTKALTTFFFAALNTSRNWTDTTNLSQPGFRDRVVKVLQTSSQGGMNLGMDGATINRLSARGRAAASAMVDQFTRPRYPAKQPEFTGWDNHRWVRFRALMAALPGWLHGIQRGGDGLPFAPDEQPSYRTKGASLALADELMAHLRATGESVAAAAPDAVRDLEGAPNPKGDLRRVPKL